MTSQVIYQGSLRTIGTHLQSGNTFITDAPLDNQGRGEAFSPTDLLATSLASCMITIMGISAGKHNFELGEVEADIFKTMASNPRRVAKIQIDLRFPHSKFTDKQKKLLIVAARTCPVSLSLHPDLVQEINFNFP